MIGPALRRLLFILILLTAPGLAPWAAGAVPTSTQGEPPPAQEPVLDDPFGRTTPQGTVLGFMKAVDREEYEQAVEYLDTRQPTRRAQQLARELQFILDRGLSGSLPKLSKKPEGDLGDMLPPNRERIGVIKTASGSYDIFLDRVQKGNDPPVWFFSSQTLKQVPEIYEALGRSWFESYLPKPLLEGRLFGFSAWRWISFFVVIPFAFLAAWVVTHGLLSVFRLLLRRSFAREGERTAVGVKGPVRILTLSLTFYISSFFSYSLTNRLFWGTVAATLAAVGIVWLCLRLGDFVAFRMEERLQGPVSSGRIATTRLVSKLSKGLIVVVGAGIVFYIAGFNFTAVLTGLGVGGIAVAFAAQKTIENLFGGIMLVSDQPVRVGDFCRAGDYRGTVEDIGLRSTRLRTLDRTAVFVPNGQLAAISVENFTLRDKILFNHRIQLRHDTSPDQLRRVLAEVRAMLSGHPKVEAASSRHRFVGFKDSSFDLEVFAYVLETSYEAFLEVQEDLLLRIVEIVEASGTGLALPSRTLYIRGDTGSDKAKDPPA
jgi:MscS family membrane protein